MSQAYFCYKRKIFKIQNIIAKIAEIGNVIIHVIIIR